jgi:1-acyl-sn-glycerol-3-phosphate acyltransferase
MLRTLAAPVIGATSMLFMALNTIVCVSALMPFALAKLVLPYPAVRRRVDPILNAIAEAWIAANGWWLSFVARVQWDIRGQANLRRDRWYLVAANHQTWVDILVLQEVFLRKIPMLKFFLKRELIRVPVIGFAWWALDFPFMRRHSEAFLREHPERRGDDIAAIRRSCERFALIPTAVINFFEGTRFTPHKKASDESPYRHLLKPKSGGVALALDAMGELFHSLLDVTIYYPDGAPTFFGFASGRAHHVVVDIRERAIPANLLRGNYALDADYRARIRDWVSELWSEKDALLEELRSTAPATPSPLSPFTGRG